MFRRLNGKPGAVRVSIADRAKLGQAIQTVKYFGKPRAIAKFDVNSLVALAQQAGGTIVMACAVGDTLVEGTVLLRLHDARASLPEEALFRGVVLGRVRTFEQDPKYPIRLLVDIAIKALSPAINDPTRPRSRRLTSSKTSCTAAGLGRSRRRLCLRQKWRPSAGLSDADLGGLSDALVRRDPTVRLQLNSGHSANEVSSRRSHSIPAEPRTGRRGAAVPQTPRPFDRGVAI